MTAAPSEPYVDPDAELYCGDALAVLRQLPDDAVDACVTSPPYLDARPEYPSPSLHTFEEIFRELGRVVRGPLALNVGRTWREGLEILWWVELLQRAEWAGWPLRDTIVWVKPNANPIHGEILADSHEYVFLFGDGFRPDELRTEYAPSSLPRLKRKWVNGRGVKNDRAKPTQDERAANELGARARSFTVAYVGRHKGNEHPAPMAEDLCRDLIALTTAPNAIVMDPFAGSGTTLLVARKMGRRSMGIELDEKFFAMAVDRLKQQSLFAQEIPA